jgi:quercetin dioxygenase-like cupin family protein
MNGKFILGSDVERETLDWGTIGHISRPPSTGARDVTAMEVTLKPGMGHNFHKHPNQEEVIYVMDGEIEQWLEANKQILRPGDSVFIPADIIHASFNVGSETARLFVVLGPCDGDSGYVSVEVADQTPWNTLR